VTRKRTPAAPWGNRIIKTGTVKAGELLANPNNWRIHPKGQQDVLSGMLGSIGFVAGVLINMRSDPSWGRDRNIETMVDGHLRAGLALDRGDDTEVPATWVDLVPEEEAAVLATLDPIAAMATTDDAKLAGLVAEMPEDLRALTEVLRQERKGKKVVFEAVDHHRVTVECESENQRVALIERLIAEGYAAS